METAPPPKLRYLSRTSVTVLGNLDNSFMPPHFLLDSMWSPPFSVVFRILSVFNFWHFDYDLSRPGPVCVLLSWDSLCLLNLCDTFLYQDSNICGQYLFKRRFCIPYSFFSPSGIPMVRIFYTSCCPRAFLSCSPVFKLFCFVLFFWFSDEDFFSVQYSNLLI